MTPLARGLLVDSGGIFADDPHIYAGYTSTVTKLTDDGPSQVWQTTSGSVQDMAVDFNGNVYANGSGNNIIKLSPDGTELWQFDAGGVADGLCCDDQGSIYFNAGSGFTKVNTDGSQVWQASVDPDQARGVAVDATYAYCATSGNGDFLYKVNRDDGSTVWSLSSITSGGIYDMSIDRFGNIYVAVGDGEIRKYDPDGTELWTATWGADTIAVDYDGNVAAGTRLSTYQIRKFDTNGSALWTYTIDANPAAALEFDEDGNLYWADSGQLEKLDPDGSVIWNTGSNFSALGTMSSLTISGMTP